MAGRPGGRLLGRNYTDHGGKMGHPVSTFHHFGIGCQIDARVVSRELKRIDGVLYEGPNHGYLCVKGRWGYDYAQHPERLKTPLIRRGDRFDPASWDEALAYIAFRLAPFRDGSFMAVGSTKVTTEEAYLFQLFARAVMGTNNIDSKARWSQAPW